ncbi:hypothetical protein BH09CHL1_BH09CHL1_10900 [soil metagenome]
MAPDLASIGQTTDKALIDLLRHYSCELIVGRSGTMSVQMPPEVPENSIIWPVVREAFRRRATLTPYARVNGIRLRALGSLRDAA